MDPYPFTNIRPFFGSKIDSAFYEHSSPLRRRLLTSGLNFLSQPRVVPPYKIDYVEFYLRVPFFVQVVVDELAESPPQDFKIFTRGLCPANVFSSNPATLTAL